MSERPLVSICCLTFNHEKYIRDAIEGFLMQKTSFPIEIIIHDDASTDNTASIIREYEEKYPDIVKPIYQKENQWSKGIKPSPNYVWPKAQGKYIALCEGDDYWTDSHKLQKQVNFLEAHPECVLCHHWQTYAHPKEDGSFAEEPAPTQNQGYLPQEVADVSDVFANRLRVKTRTNFFKNVIKKYPNWLNQVAFGDVPLSMILGEYGKFGFIDEPMSVYRQTGKGVSSDGRGQYYHTLKHYLSWIEVWEYGLKHHRFQYYEEGRRTIIYFYDFVLNRYKYHPSIFFKLCKYSFVNSKLPFFKKVSVGLKLIRLYLNRLDSREKVKKLAKYILQKLRLSHA
jgi:glycosyltransferase involved in cell wall biosynthesis